MNVRLEWETLCASVYVCMTKIQCLKPFQFTRNKCGRRVTFLHESFPPRIIKILHAEQKVNTSSWHWYNNNGGEHERFKEHKNITLSAGVRGRRRLNQGWRRAAEGVRRVFGSHSKHRRMKSTNNGSSQPLSAVWNIGKITF